MAFVDGFFVLPADVKIRARTPADGIPAELGTGGFVISRPGGRVHPRLIPQTAVDCLEFFREPTLVETAIIRYCKAHGGYPPDVLSSLVPLLCDLMNQAYLVSPDSGAARSATPSLSRDQSVGDFDVVKCVRASIDTEVYLARHRSSGALAALKIESPAHLPGAAASISHESRILAEIDCAVTPRLLERGQIDGSSYLLAEWCEGRCPEELTAASRYRKDLETRRNALDACCQIVEGYTQLHSAGVLHGDVQPFNIVLPERGPARLIDFGLAIRSADERDPNEVHGGRADPFIEPEVAAAALKGEPPPPSSAKGEQYLIASILYRVLTGSAHVELSVVESELLSRIASSEIRPFNQVGHSPWPDVEEPLARALSRDPNDRFDSVEELRRAFDEARRRLPPRRKESERARLQKLIDRVVERYADLPRAQAEWTVPSEGLSEGLEPDLGVNPHSLVYGSAGVALGLLQISRLRADPALLASADIWLTRSLRACGALSRHDSAGDSVERAGGRSQPDLVLNVPAHTILPTTAGTDDISLYLGTPGLHFADALIASSSGDRHRTLKALDRFLVESARHAGRLELFGGRAGTLLGLSLIQRACSEQFSAQITDLRESGNSLCQAVLEQIAESGRVGATGPENLGIAHGWAGILYGVMHWLESSGRSLPDLVRYRLEELAAQGVTWGDALRWPWVVTDGSGDVEVLFTSGWCNGSAGFIQLWLLAHALEPDEKYLKRAEASAISFDTLPQPPIHLCCGTAGMVYALLRLFQVTDDEAWLDRARHLLENSIAVLPRGLERNNRASLFRGEVGVAVAASEVAAPGGARMPAFG